MSIARPLSAPLYTGAATSEDTRWDVSIGGHGYMIDRQAMDQFGRQSVGLIRQQADTADKPGEASLNPEGPWRRALESWHLGAGQTWFDKPDSSPYRFRTSKGVDPWTKYGLSLLPDTTRVASTTGTNLYAAIAGGRLYYSDGQTVKVSGVGNTTFAAATGLPAQTVASITSSGPNVYVSFASGGVGIYQTNGTAFTSLVGLFDFPLVRHVMGRLLASGTDSSLYNVTSSGLGNAIFTHPLGNAWTWTDMTEGLSFIYASGYAGDRSMVYRIGIGTDAATLDVPIVACPLPDGELAMSLQGYLGFIVIGTNKGVRFAAANGDGSLTLGSLIPTGSPVLCSEGQDRFVWYGLTNYDTGSTGLGRLDLQNFTANVTPAYASDLMASGQGTVQSVVTYAGKRVFTVSGLGVYMEAATKVTSGTVTSGRITYGLPDTKTAVELQVRHDPLPASAEVDLYLSLDGANATFLGNSDLDNSTVSASDDFALNQARATFFEITTTLLGDMTLRRVTMQADPSARRTSIFQVPLQLTDTVTLPGRVPVPFDVDTEFNYLMGLLRERTVVTYQEADDSYRCVLDDYTWRPAKRGDNFWNGTFIARLKEI